jgi:hypothetical protein
MVFEILQIQDFHISIFMQKLSGISSGKNNKSCGVFYNESNKIGFAVFWFFYDLLRNLQESATTLYYFSYPFAVRPLKRFPFSQCGPWGRSRRGSGRNPARVGGGVGRGRAWCGARVARGRFRSELGAEMAGGEASGGAQRRQPLWSQLRRGLGRGEGVERFGSFLRG